MSKILIYVSIAVAIVGIACAVIVPSFTKDSIPACDSVATACVTPVDSASVAIDSTTAVIDTVK